MHKPMTHMMIWW